MKRPVGMALFASGRGSNAAALLQACRDGRLDARGSLVVSNHEDAGVHQVAREYGVPSVTLRRDQFDSGQAFADTLIAELKDRGTDLICLAGYLRKIPPRLIRAYPRALLNIHPALLPRHGGKGMYGLNVHQSVLDSDDAVTGVTVHYVTEDYDEGSVLLQRGGVTVHPGDTAETLAARVLEQEHTLYPEAVQLWIEQHAE